MFVQTTKIQRIHKIKDPLQRKQEYRKLGLEMNGLKKAIINGHSDHSKPEYHQWLKENLMLLCPQGIVENVAYDVACNPCKYLKYAIYINKQIIHLNEKPYQFIPQRNTMIPHYITLDTTDMIDIIDNEHGLFSYTKTQIYRNIQKYQPHIWSQILKLEKKSLFQQNKYSFHYQLKTNGWSCCLLYILNHYKGKKYRTRIPKQMSESELDTNRFKVLESLTEEECLKYQSNLYKRVGNDPGKRHLLTMVNEWTDDQHQTFQYSACQRRNENYTKRSIQIINDEKLKNGITQIESTLSKTPVSMKRKRKRKRFYHNRTKSMKNTDPPPELEKEKKLVENDTRQVSKKRSIDPSLYTQYVDQINQVNSQVKSFYEEPLFRKLEFRRYVRSKQCDMELIRSVRQSFLNDQEINEGKRLVIFYGDYSRTTQMNGCVPAPNISLKRLLSKFFDIVDVKEAYTSQKYWKTHEQLINARVRMGHHTRSIHGVLIPTEKPERCIHVDRDVNASHNILYLANYYMAYKGRPEAFRPQ